METNQVELVDLCSLMSLEMYFFYSNMLVLNESAEFTIVSSGWLKD